MNGNSENKATAKGQRHAAPVICLAALALIGCGQEDSESMTTAQQAASVSSTLDEGDYDLSAEANARFLGTNTARGDVMVRPSGLQYRVLETGNGASPHGPHDIVTVTYKGSLIDGRVFDQTQPGFPAQFPAGGLIRGWIEALWLMREGDSWELVVPSDLAYGEEGYPGIIPPNQTLVFTLKLLAVEPAD